MLNFFFLSTTGIAETAPQFRIHKFSLVAKAFMQTFDQKSRTLGGTFGLHTTFQREEEGAKDEDAMLAWEKKIFTASL